MALLAAPVQDAASNPSGKAKRQWACDSNSMDSGYLPPSHPHPYKRTGSTPTHSFRAGSTEQPQTLCVICLYRPHPNRGVRSRKGTLSDGEPAFSTRSKLGHLIDCLGKSLCVDFQLPKVASNTPISHTTPTAEAIPAKVIVSFPSTPIRRS